MESLTVVFSSSNSSNEKWFLREREEVSIVESIDRKLIDKLENTIHKLYFDSDRSVLKTSGDNDTMYTSIEVDQFDQCLVS